MRKALWQGWLAVVRKIGYVQSQLVLTLIYFVLVAPFALAVRLFSDPLRLRRPSSWQWLSAHARSSATLNSVRQQF